MKFYIRILICTLLLFLTPAAFAENKEKTLGAFQRTEEIAPNEAAFKISSPLELSSGITIPKGSVITVQIIDIQDQRRWHKSAFLICQLKSYVKDAESMITNVRNTNTYLIIRKYEAIDKKEVGKTAVELSATTAAAFVIPGIDIAYYFTKGVIKKEEGKTRFKSGVSSAYENSIFWFWLKGKSLELDENTTISLKEISKEKAMKLKADIERRQERTESIKQKKENVKEFMSF